MTRWRFAGALALLALAVAPSAPAAPAPVAGHVRLLQSNTISPRARRCLTRLREELTAGGFDVTVAEFGAGGEALWMVDPPTVPDGSLAVITLVGNPDQEDAELWVVDSVAGAHTAVRRLLVPAGAGTHDDEVLAIRTLEFLRASALELARRVPPPAPPRTTPTIPAAPTTPAVGELAAAPAVQPPFRHLSFELGLGLLESSLSLGPAYLPLVRLRATLVSLLEARLTVAGLGTRPRVTNAEGTATVDSSFGLLDLRAAFRPGRTVRPAVGAGGGVLFVQVEGTGNWPYGGLSSQAWSALFEASAGLTVALGRRFALALEEHAQIATRFPAVQFSGETAARLARPALLTSLTLVTGL